MSEDLEYKLDYERYLHQRIESEAACQKAARSPPQTHRAPLSKNWPTECSTAPIQTRTNPAVDDALPGEMLEARYHESLSRMLLPSPLVPASRIASQRRLESCESCAMEMVATCKPHPTPLMDISISRQLDCRKRSSAQQLEIECSSPKRTRGLQQGE